MNSLANSSKRSNPGGLFTLSHLFLSLHISSSLLSYLCLLHLFGFRSLSISQHFPPLPLLFIFLCSSEPTFLSLNFELTQDYCAVAKPLLSSLPLEVLVYFNWHFGAFFFLLNIALFAFKGRDTTSNTFYVTKITFQLVLSFKLSNTTILQVG